MPLQSIQDEVLMDAFALLPNENLKDLRLAVEFGLYGSDRVFFNRNQDMRSVTLMDASFINTWIRMFSHGPSLKTLGMSAVSPVAPMPAMLAQALQPFLDDQAVHRSTEHVHPPLEVSSLEFSEYRSLPAAGSHPLHTLEINSQLQLPSCNLESVIFDTRYQLMTGTRMLAIVAITLDAAPA
ncbi:hypothetical protein DM01DRAFT_1376714 [Hesseltinella vesiculosa]|uniref:Uncharacterized protein n=1 Tax=Hesseltinella vesiculosa TaxID=101127 RepID=A0A1X2G9G8_9FUNG|nr:hypothetical protein DM01DRAFT_1376714 [Hesseltinella vesiculosa]